MIADVLYSENPVFDLAAKYTATAALWAQCRAGGQRLLPYAGGVVDQPAWLMDAFTYLDHLHGKARK